ncbi:MAG TPA: UDP-2,3-diacylglucosamine diphosphatase [Cellvibrio sp.]|nr:UDP-2,3-diacylglucosamine diphosphatase [Cellvibrio sp.]
MRTLFIADLHLHETRPQITQAFFAFLHANKNTTEALYILGDFFDAWIGDDDDSPLCTAVAAELKQFGEDGAQVFLMHGNRDFLLGEKFAERAGATLLPESTLINLYGQPTLLLHGDELCIDDKDYMAFRQQVRSPQWQAQILSQPLAARRVLAAQLREKSQAMNSVKAEDIMDVAPAEVVRVMTEAGIHRLIHGHTHRPARHALTLQGVAAERIVLGDWHHQAWALVTTEDGLDLVSWTIA